MDETGWHRWHAEFDANLQTPQVIHNRLVYMTPECKDAFRFVANLWVNRLIGDTQPGAAKITWTALPTYRADAPLRPSGLSGPVRLVATDR